MSAIVCEVGGVRTQLPPRTASFELGAKPAWLVHGGLGPVPLTDRALDLLDLAGAIYRLESQIRRRTTDPAIEWKVRAPVRDPEFWRAQGGEPLASVLGFLNRARWHFEFEPRDFAPILDAGDAQPGRIDEIVLFSGGMDSLCGAGSHEGRKDRCRLVSFYHGQAAMQQELAAELGYGRPVQWRLAGRRGKEGMNLIRSAMFQVLAAIVAHSCGARSIYQYENGVLGLAIPQSGNFIPTRHAHPETHRRMAKLLAEVLGGEFSIANPFLPLTKREVGERLAGTIGEARADALMRRTESCWYLAQPQVAGLAKGNGQPCGACAPCLVRLTARPGELDDFKWSDDPGAGPGYAFDMRRDEYREKEKLGLTFRAHLELIQIVTSATDDASLIDSLAPEARVVVDNRNGPDEALVAGVLRRFAAEFCETFGIRVAGRS